jgi:hypothetical protein
MINKEDVSSVNGEIVTGSTSGRFKKSSILFEDIRAAMNKK